MEILEAINSRHSVRSFTDEPLSEAEQNALQAEIEQCNTESGLHMELVCNEPQAFDSTLAHYGKFSNVKNYFLLAGAKTPDLEEKCGYYGQRIVLLAQQLGLNSCWVGLTFKKRFVKKMVSPNDKLVIVVALGHGTEQGKEHKIKTFEEVCTGCTKDEAPDWFVAGINAALLAPTAMNQQSFEFSLSKPQEGDAIVSLRSKGGSFANVDLGIVRLHFELGANAAGGTFTWSN